MHLLHFCLKKSEQNANKITTNVREEEAEMNTLSYMIINPGDWKCNIGIQSLGYFERGVYMELLILMHDTEGMLALNGKPLGIEQLSNYLHIETEKLKKLLELFLSVGCISITESGIIYSQEIRKFFEKAKQLGEKRRRARTKGKQNVNKTGTNSEQNDNKTLTKHEQNTNKMVTNDEQNVIKMRTNDEQNGEQNGDKTVTNDEQNANKTETKCEHNVCNAESASNNNEININKNINNKIFINSASARDARACAREGEIEPPPGMPKSEEEAVAMAEAAGVPESFTREKAYPRILSVGYMEGKTQIRNFGQWAKLYYGNWINNQKRNQKENKPEKKIKSYMFDDKPLPRL